MGKGNFMIELVSVFIDQQVHTDKYSKISFHIAWCFSFLPFLFFFLRRKNSVFQMNIVHLYNTRKESEGPKERD